MHLIHDLLGSASVTIHRDTDNIAVSTVVSTPTVPVVAVPAPPAVVPAPPAIVAVPPAHMPAPPAAVPAPQATTIIPPAAVLATPVPPLRRLPLLLLGFRS
jgi:hypothetical protein